jgi:hypothetical protein
MCTPVQYYWVEDEIAARHVNSGFEKSLDVK